MNLSKKTLTRIWEHALERMKNTVKDPHESNGLYLARCWMYGFFVSLAGEGYDICVSRDGKEVWSSKQL